MPYHHANVDSDEVLFYSDGDFMSRKGSGIGKESISFHPSGFVHGPQPGSIEASVDVHGTEETAVMRRNNNAAPMGFERLERAVPVDAAWAAIGVFMAVSPVRFD